MLRLVASVCTQRLTSRNKRQHCWAQQCCVLLRAFAPALRQRNVPWEIGNKDFISTQWVEGFKLWAGPYVAVRKKLPFFPFCASKFSSPIRATKPSSQAILESNQLTCSASFIAFSIRACALSLTLSKNDLSSSSKASMYSLNSVLALFILVRKTNHVTHNLTLETTLNAGVNPLFINWILKQNFSLHVYLQTLVCKYWEHLIALMGWRETSRDTRGDGRIQRLFIWDTSEITHEPLRYIWQELIIVSVACSKWRHCHYFPSVILIHRRLNSRRNLFIPRGLFLQSPETFRA